ncbi:MAG: hypothetical protein LBT20_05855, partial [Clostridiales bacterium]|nr:hypothetical protein [Clostridiales bacterium]
MKKFLKIIALTILTVLVLVIGVLGQPTFTFTGNEFTKNDYSTILADNVSGNPLVTDIALLAAHDTLSEAITRSSKPSVGGALASDSLKFWTDTGIFQGAVGGFIARNSIAQKSEVYPLLTHGVRYLDIRIAEHDGEWYGCHGLLAAPIDGFLTDTIRFLSETTGEFVVVELRHTYFETVGYYELFEYIASVKYEGKSLLDYVRYDKYDTPLEELRYNDAVNGGSGVIFVMREGPTCMVIGILEDEEGNTISTIIDWGG